MTVERRFLNKGSKNIKDKIIKKKEEKYNIERFKKEMVQVACYEI